MIVLDCSVAFAMAQGTPDGEALRGLFCSGERVIAPSLLYAEAANAAFRRIAQQGLPAGTVHSELEDVIGLVDEFADMEDLLPEVVSEAVRLKHPAYGMFYLVLARRRHATVATLDKKLMRLCAENGVDCIEEIAL